ncbi:hypothetical protein FHS01_003892 [Longimicrobium terrae]|uniref:Uncharacterized protein n=1 Tax=Longimicrobium terrae TaxID=1639882 RepID=A0A841H2X8_9BACT|nr:hypothetical protein [Longimicrobium terrae]MBB4637833.1 hypothetical protein [Longimicrobium terrae]MBB6072312.1 hypothetical protein [Longimicrobium terrae]
MHDDHPLDLQAIEARVRAVSSGPWASYIEGRDHWSGSDFIMTPGEDIELGATDEDQDFIAAARREVPRLVAVARRLRSAADPSGSEMDAAELARIEKLADRASPGPWTLVADGTEHPQFPIYIRIHRTREGGEMDLLPYGATADDLKFIAHCRGDIPRLIAEIRRLRAHREHSGG